MTDFIKMTEEIFYSAMSHKNAFHSKQLKLFGIRTTPRPNWQEKIIGVIYYRSTIEKFISLKGVGRALAFIPKESIPQQYSKDQPPPKTCVVCGQSKRASCFNLLKGGVERREECTTCVKNVRRVKKHNKQAARKSTKKQKGQKSGQVRSISILATTSYFERNIILKEMGFDTYADYLISPTWKKIKNRVRKAKGKFCVICRDKSTEYHHLNYGKPDLLGETIANIVPICNVCHESIEFEDGKKLTAHASRLKFEKAIQSR